MTRKGKQERRKNNTEAQRAQRFGENSPGNATSAKWSFRKTAKASKKKVKLPIIRSAQPGTLDLNNDKVFEIISFP